MDLNCSTKSSLTDLTNAFEIISSVGKESGREWERKRGNYLSVNSKLHLVQTNKILTEKYGHRKGLFAIYAKR